jgi:hypothetical protein
MKYLLKILGLSLLAIPIFIWFALVTVWTFNTYKIEEFYENYSWGIRKNYRKIFPYKSKNTF